MNGRLAHLLAAPARWAAARGQRRRDLQRGSYAAPRGLQLTGAYFSPPLPLPPRDREALRATSAAHCAHRFDLLGAGWQHARHGAPCPGLEGNRYDPGPPVTADPEGRWLHERVNPSNRPSAQTIWRLVDADYVPIDWQLDSRSGHRWREACWYRDVRYGHLPGVDIKVPWELGRMQHLCGFARAFCAARAGSEGFAAPAVYAREFRNQVLDFIATNPPRFGVQWACSMDVALRAVSWLVTFDLLRRAGAAFDRPFEEVFTRSIWHHGAHLAANLEWYPGLRGNHYLANVAGLVFIGAYLAPSRHSDAWLAFGVRELVHEVAHQFLADGGNHEASTSYHRLSGELAVHATGLVLALPPARAAALQHYDGDAAPAGPPRQGRTLPLHPLPNGTGASPFPASHWQALRRLGDFAAWYTAPDGRAIQVGDNDDGRFLKLQPAYRRLSGGAGPWREDLRDHQHLLAAVAGMFARERPAPAPTTRIDALLLQRLCSGRLATVPAPPEAPPEAGAGVWQGLRRRGFSTFGLFFYRAPRAYLALRCGCLGQDGRGGHAHNDQLAFELWLDGEPAVVGRGTYLYTAAPRWRNAFRATARHNTLALCGVEQNQWRRGPAGLFHLKDRCQAQVTEFSAQRIRGTHTGFGPPHRRTLTLLPNGLHGVDRCADPGVKRAWFHLHPRARIEHLEGSAAWVRVGDVRLCFTAEQGALEHRRCSHSEGYGRREPSHSLCCTTHGEQLQWRIELAELAEPEPAGGQET